MKRSHINEVLERSEAFPTVELGDNHRLVG